jgi:hypothetical protein
MERVYELFNSIKGQMTLMIEVDILIARCFGTYIVCNCYREKITRMEKLVHHIHLQLRVDAHHCFKFCREKLML